MSSSKRYVVRVRSRMGTWRFDNLSRKTSIATLKQRVIKEKRLGSEIKIVFSLDQRGNQPAEDSATLGALKIEHGGMLYAQFPAKSSAGTATGSRKIVNGKIVNQTYADRSAKEGFRPGLMSLRSMKMKWTLSDFQALDSRYTFSLKGKQPRICDGGVSLSSAACNSFQRYVRSYAFSPRVAHLYGRITKDEKDDGKIRIHADVFYEPPQRVEKEDVVAKMLKDDRAEIVDKVAGWLGLKRVGFVYSHPVRDEDEVGYRMSAYELLEAAEQNLQVALDSKDENCPFAVIAVTGDKDGKTMFDAFELNALSRKMIVEGALLEDEEESGLFKVHDTYTVIAEGKETKRVSTYRCLSTLAITQHTSPLTSQFPVRNRDNTQRGVIAMRSHLANSRKDASHLEKISDFEALLCLTNLMGMDSVQDLCKSVVDPKKFPIKDGYKIIIDSLLR
jgi:nuclear protein localization protein 4 homolog